MENNAHTKLNLTNKHLTVKNTDTQHKLDQCLATTTVARLQSQFNDVFNRDLAPMYLISILLQAIQNQLETPAKFDLNEPTLQLIEIIMKVARYNKASSKSVTVENSHQGCFATNQLFHQQGPVPTSTCHLTFFFIFFKESGIAALKI